MLEEIYREVKDKMEKSLTVLKDSYSSFRTGRANPALVNKLKIEYYGSLTPMQQLASISVPEPRCLLIRPYDPSVLKAIEKAIMASDIGIMPHSDGNIIRLSIPPLTSERRKELVKIVRKKNEEAKIALRNIRREYNAIIKDLEKEKQISEDDQKRALDEIQKITDTYISKFDEITVLKEKEIMET